MEQLLKSLVFGLDLAFDKFKVLLALSFGLFDYLFFVARNLKDKVFELLYYLITLLLIFFIFEKAVT
jgi:hypothetical protein